MAAAFSLSLGACDQSAAAYFIIGTASFIMAYKPQIASVNSKKGARHESK
jgi:hypothetical protein